MLLTRRQAEMLALLGATVPPTTTTTTKHFSAPPLHTIGCRGQSPVYPFINIAAASWTLIPPEACDSSEVSLDVTLVFNHEVVDSYTGLHTAIHLVVTTYGKLQYLQHASSNGKASFDLSIIGSGAAGIASLLFAGLTFHSLGSGSIQHHVLRNKQTNSTPCRTHSIPRQSRKVSRSPIELPEAVQIIESSIEPEPIEGPLEANAPAASLLRIR